MNFLNCFGAICLFATLCGLTFDVAIGRPAACPSSVGTTVEIFPMSGICHAMTVTQLKKFVAQNGVGRAETCMRDGKLIAFVRIPSSVYAWDMTTNAGYKTCNGKMMRIGK